MIPDRASYALLWRLLSVLVRANGIAEGHEYAELLLGGTFEQRQAELEMDEPVQVVDDHTQINEPVSNELKNPRTGRGYTQGETLARFRELIQYGRQKDALEWAMRTQLWGHALMLAYKMDSTKHTHVMGRFCQAMASHDPLQTAYQFLSGRQPSGEWANKKPHSLNKCEMRIIFKLFFERPFLSGHPNTGARHHLVARSSEHDPVEFDAKFKHHEIGLSTLD